MDMKKIMVLIALLSTMAGNSRAQDVNWRSFSEKQQNLVYSDLGYDFGVTTQLGYGHVMNFFKPVVLNLEYSMPMGGDLFDDFKFRYGGRIEVFEKKDFSLSAKLVGNFRRYQTAMARILSFGGELSAIGGYFRPTFHVAVEMGLDESILSHMNHSHIMSDNYPDIQDGWYRNTGGHYFYGIQGSKSIGGSFDTTLRLGATKAHDKDHDILPYYFQIGLIKRL